MGAVQFWEERYASRPQVWSGRANQVLVDLVSGFAPRTALDLGCGEGGDAVWLAQQGWRVTAVDISTTAVERGRAAAADLGVPADRITWVAQDLAEMRDKFAEMESQPGTLLDAIEDHLPEGVDKCFDPRRAALALEVVAEAARNPKVAAIVRYADEQERSLARTMMERDRKPEWSEAEFQARC